MNKNKTLVRYLVFTIVSGIIAIGAFVSLFLSGIFIVIERTPFIRASMAVIAIVFGASSIMFSRAWIEHRHFIEQLYLENTYTLGQESPFYNFDAFKNKASKMSRRRILRKYRRFIIAFTSSSEKITSNSFHNDMISSLNFATASYLSELFDGRGKYAKRFNVYGFNRGIFLMFIFVDNEKDVPELISLISTNIYRIIKERNLKVYVQPFFGIKEMEEGENIVSAIEDSFIARNVSESNFETYTFFNPFKRTSDISSSHYFDEMQLFRILLPDGRF